MSKTFQGKGVLITGASEGVGKAIAEIFGPLKMKLGLVARSQEKLEEVAKIVTRAGSQALILKADLRDQSRIESIADEFKNEFGVPDFLINNAGIGVRSYWEDTNLESELDITKVNYIAPMILIRTFLPGMLEADKGHIININTIGGLYSAPYQGAYCASKWALLSYTESLAYELENTNVSISTLFPGPIDTNFLNDENYESFKKSPDMVSPGYMAGKVLSVMNKPAERVFIGPLWKLLAVKIGNFYPQFFRKIFEKKNLPPKRLA
jgi:short-subunit dehydrogenase